MSDAATYHRGQRNFGTGYDMMVSIEALEAKLALMMFERDEAWKRAAHAEKMWGEAEAKLATCEKYRDAYAECDRIGTKAVRDFEAKLETAVEALNMLVRDCEADYPPSHVAIKYFAIGVLAEIKRESHDTIRHWRPAHRGL